MKEKQLYDLWLQKATEDEDLQQELRAVAEDEDGIIDRFYRDLEFGTGGLRGVIGAGTNRMNIYTVRRATQGFADYLNEAFEHPSVSVSFDSRIKSDRFAIAAACVMAANGIKVHLFPELMPTPVLSFAVRYYNCQGGIMVTASHNPAKYNGYKAYGPDGSQLNLEMSERVIECVGKVDIFEGVRSISLEEGIGKGLIEYIGDELLNAFLTSVQEQQLNPEVFGRVPFKVVYTPLNGTGNRPVREILRRVGLRDVSVVPEQEKPDGNFPTAPFPNPEIREAFGCALKLAEQVKPDILLATDPDCDRVGIAVLDEGEYKLMSGNEVGAMLAYYILSEKSAKGLLPKNPILIKTIVSTDIAAAIARKYGCEVIEVLTGFKFIGEQMTLLAEKGEGDRYVFGFEESYGYLAGTHARDKDAVVASMLICEMAAFYKEKGKTLIGLMQDIYSEFGLYLHKQVSFTCEGVTGMQRMDEIMASLRQNPPKQVAGLSVTEASDYLGSVLTDMASGSKRPITLPKSNVLGFKLEGGASFIIRPSGTEPKIKVYINAKSNTNEACREQAEAIERDVTALMGF